MNIKESLSNFGFALTLIGLSFNRPNQTYGYCLAGILALFGFIVLFERVWSNKIWTKITDGVEYLDITNIAFGFGVIDFSTKFLTNPNIWLRISHIGCLE